MLRHLRRMSQLSSTKLDTVGIYLLKQGQRDEETCVRSVTQQGSSRDERELSDVSALSAVVPPCKPAVVSRL